MRPLAASARPILPVLAAALALAGCAAIPTETHVLVPPGRYPDAFEATRDALRLMHFDLDEINARQGTITTLPRSSSGWATPWVDHASTADDASRGLAHRERRIARVTFLPHNQIVSATSPDDLRTYNGEIILHVDVRIERLYNPGRRVDADSVRFANFTIDPLDPVDRERLPVADAGADPNLAARIASNVRSVIHSESAKNPDGASDADSP